MDIGRNIDQQGDNAMVAKRLSVLNSPGLCLGPSVLPLIVVQVTPLVWSKTQPISCSFPPPLSCAQVKHLLRDLTLRTEFSKSIDSRIHIEWTKDRNDSHNGLKSGYLYWDETPDRAIIEEATFPIFHLPSDDPTELEPIPCRILVYTSNKIPATEIMVTKATLVRVLPLQLAHSAAGSADSQISTHDIVRGPYVGEQFLQSLAGELDNFQLSEELQTQVLNNHNPETIQELTLRMSLLLSQPVHIGTTADALDLHREQKSRKSAMRRALVRYCDQVESSANVTIITSPESAVSHGNFNRARTSALHWEPSLIVHSSAHATGKTLLVQAIAKQLDCVIHVIPVAPLLAKYGIHADAGLESLLHSIIMSAAVSDRPICIILDHLDAFLPPRLSGRTSAGDTAVPIFTAISSYLKTITSCLSRRQVFPFPLKNPLYNLSGTHGRVLSLRLCLVGIVTCPDDGWRMGEGNTTILDSMIGGRYRLPSLTGSTRLTALQASLQDEGIDLTNGAQDKLPILAASAAWAKGSAFQRIARQLRELLEIKYGAKGMIASMATLEDLSQSIAAVGKGASSTATEVSFQAQESDPQDSGGLFESVGGNTEAKRSLEDALALDPVKRQILARFGLSPPTGILLYGPPGCGKTLLAKAVAKLLNVSQSSLGGAFISLRSSDIVRAEVGTSEKMVASAFELARKNAPSVIFIDEFQALFTERSSGGSAKLASTLLQCMDDVKRWRDVSSSAGSIGGNHGKGAESNRVVVLGATNTPWMVDSAFLRPGRFDRVVHIGLPTRVEREAILRVHMGRMKIIDKGQTAALPVLCSRIAEHTGGFSGADLAALCRSAAIRCLLGSGEDCEIEDRHFLEALKNDVKASCSEDLVQRLLKWRP